MQLQLLHSPLRIHTADLADRRRPAALPLPCFVALLIKTEDIGVDADYSGVK